MKNNSNANPRKSSNRGHQNKKNNSNNFIDPIFEFDQEMENLIFSSLGLDNYINSGISSGFYDYDSSSSQRLSIKPQTKHLTIDERIKKSFDVNNLPF